MKRKIVLILAMILLMLASMPVFAAGSFSQRLIDDADLLDEDVEEELADRLDDLAEKYGLDAVIITVEDYRTYDSSIYAYSPEDFGKAYYQNNGYGFDDENSGMLLLISMEERDCELYIQGEARVAVNNYGFDYISDRLVDKLGDDEYEEAIVRYVDDVENFYQEYDKGTPYGSDRRVRDPQRILKYFGIALAGALLLAVIVVSVMKSGMNTAKPQLAAREYVKKGSFVLTNQQDLYLYSNTTKTPIPKNNSSGAGSKSGSRGGTGGSKKF